MGHFPASCTWPGGPLGWEFCASCSSALSTTGVLQSAAFNPVPSCLGLLLPWRLAQGKPLVALEPSILVCVHLSSVL